jgi:predicted permease
MPNRVRTLIRVMGAAAGFLLLIACANLANLLLARSSARRKEIEIRAALGAGRERLVRQLITEGAALSVAGGLAGIALAAAAVPLLGRLVPTGLPVVSTPTIDWRVALFAFAATIVTGIAAGVLPALRVTAYASATLRVRGARSDSARRSLVIVQVAASLALVLSTGLLLRALVQVTSRDPGFETSGRMFFRTALAFPRYAETARREDFYRTVLDGVRALPGVTGASAVSFRPMGDMRGGIWSVFVPGETRTDAHAASRFVLPGYFDVMGIRILAGRDFRATDTINSQRVAVVSESFVREHWPGRLEDAIGRTFRVRFGNLSFTVAGVVSDIRFRGMEQAQHEPQMYFVPAQTPDHSFVFFAPKDFVVATALANPLTLAPAIRALIAKTDPSQPVSDIESLEQLVESDTAGRRTQVWVIAAFSIAALLLAAIGIHGLLSFAVSQRTHEIGLRRALGAQPSGIAWMVFGEAAALALTGGVIGAAAAYLLGRGVMQAVLAGVPPGDPWTAAAGVAFAMLLTLAGSLAPTIRALRVDPAIALRNES